MPSHLLKAAALAKAAPGILDGVLQKEDIPFGNVAAFFHLSRGRLDLLASPLARIVTGNVGSREAWLLRPAKLGCSHLEMFNEEPLQITVWTPRLYFPGGSSRGNGG